MWMIFLLITITPISKADFLSDLMLYNSIEQDNSQSTEEQGEDHSLDNGESYSWELGTPDNQTETVIVYDQTGCYCD